MLSARVPESRGCSTDSRSSSEEDRAESLDWILDVFAEAIFSQVLQPGNHKSQANRRPETVVVESKLWPRPRQTAINRLLVMVSHVRCLYCHSQLTQMT